MQSDAEPHLPPISRYTGAYGNGISFHDVRSAEGAPVHLQPLSEFAAGALMRLPGVKSAVRRALSLFPGGEALIGSLIGDHGRQPSCRTRLAEDEEIPASEVDSASCKVELNSRGVIILADMQKAGVGRRA